MLSACCACLLGADAVEERPNRIQSHDSMLSINSTSPTTPGNMLLLPRHMQGSGEIHIEGKVSRNESLCFALKRSKLNVSRKIELDFMKDCSYQYDDTGLRMEIPDFPPVDNITDADFKLSVIVKGDEENRNYRIFIKVGENDLFNFTENDISSIKYLEFSDNVSVSQLTFKYDL